MIGNKDLILYKGNAAELTMQLNHCGFQKCNSGYHYTNTFRPYHLIHFVLDGKGSFTLGNASYELQKGQAFYIPAGSVNVTYTASLNSPWTYCWIGVIANAKNPFLKLLFPECPVIDIAMPQTELEKLMLSIVAVTDKRVENISTYRKEDFPGEQFIPITTPTQSLEANSRMYYLFSQLLDTQTKNSFSSDKEQNYAADAKAFIDDHYCEPIKIKDIADMLHIHPNYLTNIFKKVYHQTPKAYLHSLRMYRATQLLITTDYPISVVAESSGFTNPFRFSAAFKDYFDISPVDYRKNEQ